MIRCLSTSTALSSPAMPDAGSRWPDVRLDRPDGNAPRVRRPPRAWPSAGPPSGPRRGCRCRAPRRTRVRPGPGARTPAGAAPPGRPGSAGPARWCGRRCCWRCDHRVDAVTVGHCVGQPLEHGHAAALGPDEPVGPRGEGGAPAGRREHPRLVNPMKWPGVSSTFTPPASTTLLVPSRRVRQPRSSPATTTSTRCPPPCSARAGRTRATAGWRRSTGRAEHHVRIDRLP